MTLQLLIQIILWAFITILILGLAFVSFLIGRRTIRDNIRLALVFVKTGRHISIPYKGKMIGNPTKRGSKYAYNNGKVVFVPAEYEENYHRNKRIIFINRVGQLIATPFDSDTPLSDNEKDELIYELVSSHIGADGMRALKGNKKMNILLVVVIAFVVGLIAIFGYNYMQGTMSIKPSTSQTIEQTTSDNNTSVEKQKIIITPIEVDKP